MKTKLIIVIFVLIVVTFGPLANTAQQNEPEITEPVIFDTREQRLAADTWLPQLASKRVVYIGEHHDRYDHHLNQLAIIRALNKQSSNQWAIGLEMFPQRVQAVLDAYSASELDEYDFIKASHYYQNWGYDYRLYRPLLQYAKTHNMPLVALNIDNDISRRIARVGLSGLSETERQQLPEQIDQSDEAYRSRLKAVFAEHPNQGLSFENFWQAQLAWDESMADRAARYLAAYPDKRLIIIAGSGHLAYRSGIPQRLERRLPIPSALLLPVDTPSEATPEQGADFLILSEPDTVSLPDTGRMGIMLDLADGIKAQQVLPDSAAKKAGLLDADHILSINGQSVQTLGDVRLALLDKKPGEQISIQVRRGNESLAFTLILQ